MRLLYYKTKTPNFGDDLNALVWPALAADLFERQDDLGFLGIGTIIGMPTEDISHLHIFSSGTGYDDLDKWKVPHSVWCVRGPLTAAAIGASAKTVITDGAILTPRVAGFPHAGVPCGRPVVVPHWATLEYGGWKEACALAGLDLLDPRGTPQDVIARIAAAPLVLTESLHGAILADVYGIPWTAFATSKNFSIFKWVDWSSSMDIPLRVVTIPPPSAETLLAFGRAPGATGDVMAYSSEDAMNDLFERKQVCSAPPVETRGGGLKCLAKGILRSVPITQKLLGLSPAKTADALLALRDIEPSLSREPLRRSKQEQMLDRLDSLRRSLA